VISRRILGIMQDPGKSNKPMKIHQIFTMIQHD